MRIGSLFSGYGGLDLAVSRFFNAETSWYSEIEPAACKILEAHYPGIQNLGDVTIIDWASVSPIDILIGGYPCQPFSQAGHRKGKNDERHLWPFVGAAIGALRPRYVVLENVRGHVSLGLADVIGDLAGMGYDARWGVVRASDAGAPHGRARVFIVAYPYGSGLQGYDGERGEASSLGSRFFEQGASLSANPDVRRREQRHTRCGDVPVADAVSVDQPNDGGPSVTDSSSREWGGPQSDNLPQATGQAAESGERPPVDWGKYGPAIQRWERITRPVPAPTVDGPNGRSRLSSYFVEWMMGLPEGWVTGHGLSVAKELKALGNGVCPQQAFKALQLLIGDEQ